MVSASNITKDMTAIAEKVRSGVRISDEECLQLFEQGSLGFVGSLANFIKEKKHGNQVF
jgi:aminodeoxyfutalosine synthase